MWPLVTWHDDAHVPRKDLVDRIPGDLLFVRVQLFLLTNCLACLSCLLPGPWQASHVVPARFGVEASSLKPLGCAVAGRVAGEALGGVRYLAGTLSHASLACLVFFQVMYCLKWQDEHCFTPI